MTHHIERRAARYLARQYVSDTHDHRPDRFSVRVLDEGTKNKRPSPTVWVPLPNGQKLRVVRDSRLHLTNRIHRIELYDEGGQNRQAVFRRATEAMRR